MTKKSWASLLSIFLWNSSVFGQEKIQIDSDYLPVIAICSKEKEITQKIDYKAKYHIFENFKLTDEEQLKCTEENTRGWDDFLMRPRGNSSYYYAKKQYLLRFQNSNGKEKMVSLGGMPEASKWVLNAPYVDRSLVRNLSAYNLGRELEKERGAEYFAPKGKPYEVYLNANYQGLYVLFEKIERSQHKVNFENINNQEKHALHFLAEISANDGDFETDKKTSINYIYPSLKKIEKIEQGNPKEAHFIKHSIQSDINSFERLLSSQKMLTNVLKNKTQNLIDTESFVDYIIVQEIFRNVDGYRRSAYFQKLEDGRIKMGPLWDYDLAMGNLSFYKMDLTEGWLYETNHSLFRNAFWFKSFLKNKIFQKKIQARYVFLREEGQLLSDSSIQKLVDKQINSLKGSPLRDSERWHNTHTYVQSRIFITKEKGETPYEHVSILKRWLINRLHWIDRNIYGMSP